jgi:pentatricopeptide repeat protein
VDEGMRLYASMIKDYMIAAELEHYTCMVDLLGHAGNLQEAENMIKSTPFKPDVTTGMGSLGGCRTHGKEDGKTCC